MLEEMTSCDAAMTWVKSCQITTHLDSLRREARVLLWDADGSGQDGWVDGVLTAQYASIDNFHGSIKLVPVSSPWYAATHHPHGCNMKGQCPHSQNACKNADWSVHG